MNQLGGGGSDGVYQLQSQSSDGATSTSNIRVRKKVVDARYLEPDLPVFVGPKFTYDDAVVKCIPVNELPLVKSGKHYVVIGGGKTGMDAITYLQTEAKVAPSNITWVVSILKSSSSLSLRHIYTSHNI